MSLHRYLASKSCSCDECAARISAGGDVWHDSADLAAVTLCGSCAAVADAPPTPYYSDELITLYHGSCLKVLPWLEGDVLITDPPYGLNAQLSAGAKGRRGRAGHQRVHGEARWDVSLTVRDEAMDLWGDTKPAAMFASPKRLDAPPFEWREVPLIWDKGEQVGMGDLSFPWRVNYELIYVRGGFSGDRTSTAILRAPLSNRDASRIGHPTPKPVSLMENLIARAPAGVIAEPFAGSGSTLLAARNLGRRCIAVEESEAYCELAANRLDQGVLDFEGLG